MKKSAITAGSKTQPKKPPKEKPARKAPRTPRGQAPSNPTLDGIRDEARCRVFEGGIQCSNQRKDVSSPFCTGHMDLVEEGKLKLDNCPVFVEATGEQCDRPSHGESGSGCGYCSKHYQSARRGTPPGKETQRRPVGSGASRIYVSFRFTDAKWFAEELRVKQGLKNECDIYKQLIYKELIKEGYGQQLLADESCKQEIQKLGLIDLLEQKPAAA